MRALFVDFDGVLHPLRAIAGAQPPLTPAQIRAGWPQTFMYLPILQALLQGHLDVAVVVSSSWRAYLRDEQLQELLRPIAPWFAGSIAPGPRDAAIRQWLQQHPVDDFLILDDMPQFFPGSWPQLLLCPSDRGISDTQVQDQLRHWIGPCRSLA